jgi:hypothetical protein
VQLAAKKLISMVYYHVLLSFVDDGKEKTIRITNSNEQQLRNEIVNPFNEDKALLVFGKFIDKTKVSRILVFKDFKGIKREKLDAELKECKGSRDFEKNANWLFHNTSDVTSFFISASNSPAKYETKTN